MILTISQHFDHGPKARANISSGSPLYFYYDRCLVGVSLPSECGIQKKKTVGVRIRPEYQPGRGTHTSAGRPGSTFKYCGWDGPSGGNAEDCVHHDLSWVVVRLNREDYDLKSFCNCCACLSGRKRAIAAAVSAV